MMAQDRPHQVLVEPHASGDAVHDDADGVDGRLSLMVMFVQAFGFSVHCGCAPGGQRRGIDAGLGQRAVQFLPPVGHVAGRSVAVKHAQRRVADVGQLVEHAGRDVDGLAGVVSVVRSSPRHIFAGAFDDEVDLFLLLVVPRHLAAVGLQGDVAHGEIGGLDGACAADQVLGPAPGGIGAAGDLVQVGDDHVEYCLHLSSASVVAAGIALVSRFGTASSEVLVRPSAPKVVAPVAYKGCLSRILDKS